MALKRVKLPTARMVMFELFNVSIRIQKNVMNVFLSVLYYAVSERSQPKICNNACLI
jgi:hypothetical protein